MSPKSNVLPGVTRSAVLELAEQNHIPTDLAALTINDLLDADENANDSTADALSYGVNNYLFYTINDCWKWGTRAEWWKSNQVTGETSSFYEVTTGLNYKASANLIVRPEVKFNWTPSDNAFNTATGGDFNDVLFGMDAIYTF